jgi:hypothetical protein
MIPHNKCKNCIWCYEHILIDNEEDKSLVCSKRNEEVTPNDSCDDFIELHRSEKI